jgi:hypothetical protein
VSQDKDLYLIAFLNEHSRNGKTIATIVPHPAIDIHWTRGIDVFKEPLDATRCRPLHKINGGNGLMLYGISIRLSHLLCREYLHPFTPLCYQPLSKLRDASAKIKIK